MKEGHKLDLSSGADEAQQAHSAAENGGRSSTTTQGPQLSASLSLRSTSSDLPPMGAGAKVAYNEDLTRIIMEHLLDAKDRNASPGLSVRPYLTICKVWKQRLDEIRNDVLKCSLAEGRQRVALDGQAGPWPNLRPAGMSAFFARDITARDTVNHVDWKLLEHTSDAACDRAASWEGCPVCSQGEREVASFLNALPNLTGITVIVDSRRAFDMPDNTDQYLDRWDDDMTTGDLDLIYQPIRRVTFGSSYCVFGARITYLSLSLGTNEILSGLLLHMPNVERLTVHWHRCYGTLQCLGPQKPVRIDASTVGYRDGFLLWAEKGNHKRRGYSWWKEKNFPSLRKLGDQSGMPEPDYSGWHQAQSFWSWILPGSAATLRYLALGDSLDYTDCQGVLYSRHLPSLDHLSFDIPDEPRWHSEELVVARAIDYSRLPCARERLELKQKPSESSGDSALWPALAAYVQRSATKVVSLFIEEASGLVASFIVREGCRFFTAFEPLRSDGFRCELKWRVHRDYPTLVCYDLQAFMAGMRSKGWISLESTAAQLAVAPLKWQHISYEDAEFCACRDGDDEDQKRVALAAETRQMAADYERRCKRAKTQAQPWPLDEWGDMEDCEAPSV